MDGRMISQVHEIVRRMYVRMYTLPHQPMTTIGLLLYDIFA